MQQLALVVLFLTATSVFSLSAQEHKYLLSPEKPFEVSVSGSSTLTDWEAGASTVTDLPASLQFVLGEQATIESFGFKVAVKSLDGGRGSAMNGKIYTALKSADHPNIIYTQTKPAQILKMPDGNYQITSTGQLSIAGTEKTIEVEVMGALQDGVLTLTGEKPLKLSEFDIEAPTAMFGQIETKDDITVHFTFNYLVQ